MQTTQTLSLGLYFLMLLPMLTHTVHADETKLSTQSGFIISSGNHSFQLGGRIMYDYDKTEKNAATVTDEFEVRRARLYIKGSVSKHWAFKSQFNLDESGVEDLYLRYLGLGKQAILTIGNQKMPFMLEALTSSTDINILERSAITERYALGREEGVVLSGTPSKNSVYAIGAYLDDVVVGQITTPASTRVTGFVDTNGNGVQDLGETDVRTVVPLSTADVSDAKIGFVARYIVAPLRTDHALLHIGLNYRDLYDNNAFGFELAGVYGPLHAQAAWIDAEEGNQDVDGYYIQAGYALTGEVRPYEGGIFKRLSTSANNIFGAWEIVARYEDGDGKYSNIELGNSDASAYTIGLNWYAPNNNVRFSVNYTDGETELGNDDGSEFRIRTQLVF